MPGTRWSVQPGSMDNTTNDTNRAALMSRAFWLLLVPTVCGSAPWVATALPADRLTAINHTTQVLVPVVGMVLVVAYRLLSPYRVRLWPFLPYVAVAVFFATSGDLFVGTQPGSEYLLMAVQLGVAYLLQPCLAFGGGLVSFVAVGERRGGLAAGAGGFVHR